MSIIVQTDIAAPRPLPQRHTPCLSRLTARRPWGPTLALRVGCWQVGVRANSAAAAEQVSALFAGARTPELDDRVPANFSVEIAGSTDSTGSRSRGLHLVYRDHEIVARRHEPGDLLLDLADLLDEIGNAERCDLLAVRAAAVVRSNQQVLLLPASWHAALLPHQARLARDGLDLLPARSHLVDGAAAQVVASTLRRRGVQPGQRLDICLWGLRVLTEHRCTLRPAEVVQLGFSTLANVDALRPRPALDGLAGLARRVPALGLPQLSSRSAVPALRELLLHA
ncbi:MAG TPA: hypothetical protein VFJ14_01355 [Nocardioidaceae bacterium]|nr:hypothetical protein [Nocardioidaceae bacterium]